MLTNRDLETHFNTLPADQLNVVVEIHNIVAEIVPSASLDFHRKGVTYFDPNRGGHVSAGICQTILVPGHVLLAFIHGACLPDPLQLLHGKTYPKRYLEIDSFDSAPWEAITDLIRESSHFDPRTNAKF
jgi:hypothetical protein